MTDDRLLDVYLPGFSGFSAPEWEALLSAPLRRAAQNHSLLEPPWALPLDTEDFADLLDGARDRRAQCSALAHEFYKAFGIQLALKVGFAHRLRFKEVHFAGDHGFEANRIVATLRRTRSIPRTGSERISRRK
jgi:hypothetical protein